MNCRLFFRALIGLVFVLFISSACSTPTSIPPEPTPIPIPPTDTPVPPTPTPEPVTEPNPPAGTPVSFGKVDVGGYGLYLMCKGEGSPTIVMDYGLYAGGSLSGQYDELKNAITAQMMNRVCTYERAGNMMSDPPPETPRTSQDMMEDLHNVLTNGNIPGPYVLVADGTANFSAQLFAIQYPEKVVGMVLISPMHPDEIATILDTLPSETSDEDDAINNMRQYYTTMLQDPAHTSEHWDFQVSLEQVQAIDTIGDLPLAVLVNSMNNPQPQIDIYRLMYGTDLTEELVENLAEETLPLKAQMTELSTNSKLMTVEDCSFFIHYEKPESVVEAVQWVLGHIESR